MAREVLVVHVSPEEKSCLLEMAGELGVTPHALHRAALMGGLELFGVDSVQARGRLAQLKSRPGPARKESK